jgi:hypothetical protein
MESQYHQNQNNTANQPLAVGALASLWSVSVHYILSVHLIETTIYCESVWTVNLLLKCWRQSCVCIAYNRQRLSVYHQYHLVCTECIPVLSPLHSEMSFERSLLGNLKWSTIDIILK